MVRCSDYRAADLAIVYQQRRVAHIVLMALQEETREILKKAQSGKDGDQSDEVEDRLKIEWIFRSEAFASVKDVIHRIRSEPFRIVNKYTHGHDAPSNDKLSLISPVNWNLFKTQKFQRNPPPISDNPTAKLVQSGGGGFGGPNTKTSATAALRRVGQIPSSKLPDGGIYFKSLDVSSFIDLDPSQTMASELPKYFCGFDLNRYLDVLPNPDTLVTLEQVSHDPVSEYINANYIRSIVNSDARAYIAAQGPTAATSFSFIRMIWEKDVDTVVMVTGLIEGKKKKCTRYWPATPQDPPLQFDEYSVACREVREMASCRLSVLDVRHTPVGGMEELREVYHYWFTKWPDHGVPSSSLTGAIDASDFLTMIKLIRARKRRGCPLLVHCSAGIGRTGTYIAIDHGMTLIERRDAVDVLTIIQEIRKDRMALVQNISQYKFAYQALLDYGSSSKRQLFAWEEGLSSSAHEWLQQESEKAQGQWSITYEGGRMLKRFNDMSPKLQTEIDEMMSIALFHNAVHYGDHDDGKFQEVADAEVADVMEVGGKNEAQSMEFVKRQDWYADIGNMEAMTIVADLAEGWFLLRPSKSKQNRWVLVVQEGEELEDVVNLEVIRIAASTYSLCSSNNQKFKTLYDLIEHYCKYTYGTQPGSNLERKLSTECLATVDG